MLCEKEINLHEIAKAIKESNLPQVECPVNHTFSGGVYIREMFAPADTIIIGKRHRYATCNILLRGTILIYTGEGVPTMRLEGPCIFTSEPMVQKMGYTVTDVVFANIHPTELTDPEEVEKEFIISEEEYVEWRAKKLVTKEK